MCQGDMRMNLRKTRGRWFEVVFFLNRTKLFGVSIRHSIPWMAVAQVALFYLLDLFFPNIFHSLLKSLLLAMGRTPYHENITDLLMVLAYIIFLAAILAAEFRFKEEQVKQCIIDLEAVPNSKQELVATEACCGLAIYIAFWSVAQVVTFVVLDFDIGDHIAFFLIPASIAPIGIACYITTLLRVAGYISQPVGLGATFLIALPITILHLNSLLSMP